MSKGEPPSADGSTFLVGRNSRGNWVVRDCRGLRGGLFVDRAQALKFAMFENGYRPQAVMMVPGILELDLSDASRAVPQSTCDAMAPLRRVAWWAWAPVRTSSEWYRS